MEQLTTKIQASYIRIIASLFDNNFSDIVAVRTIHFYLKSIIFSFFNYRLLNCQVNVDTDVSLEVAVSEMVSKKMLSSRIGVFYTLNKLQINTGFSGLVNILSSAIIKYDVKLLYEYQLSYELFIAPDAIEFIALKSSKDMTGSYYTPKELAYVTTQRAIDKYIESNIGIANFSTGKYTDEQLLKAQDLLLNSQIADLSCGCGEFLIAIQEYVYRYLKLDTSSIALNIWGIDIDPIALQIATVSALKGVQPEYHYRIIDHFVLGNPLIEKSIESSYENKVDLSAVNRIYSANMGLNLSERFAESKFDLILGNPPWEKIRLEERKFFLPLCPEISEVSQKAVRVKRIESLQNSHPALYNYYMNVASDYLEIKKLVKNNKFLEHSLVGELNTYALFAEITANLLSPNGLSGLILKGSSVTSPSQSKLFRHFVNQQIVREICLFTNINRIFNIDSRERFCTVLFSKSDKRDFEVSVGLCNVDELLTSERIQINSDLLHLINPLTGLIPNIKSKEELLLLIDAYKKLPVFDKVFTDCHFGRLVHLTSHSEHIDKRLTENNIPIYEGKFIERYDAHFSTFAGVPEEQRYTNKASAKKIKEDSYHKCKELPESRYFIQNDFWLSISQNYTEPYSLYWRSLTSSTNSRTTIATILPHCPTCQSIQLLQTSNIEHLLLMVALFNSIPFDYFVRLKLSGIDLTQNIIKQIPVPPLSAYEREVVFLGAQNPIKLHIFDRVFALYQNEDRLKALFEQFRYSFSMPYGLNKPQKTIMDELDSLVAQAYSIAPNLLKTMASTF